MRRPLASQVSDIGIWSNILEGMTYLAVGFNVSTFLAVGFNVSTFLAVGFKLWQITWPGIAIRQKLANSEIISLWTYEKLPRIICLDPKSNTYILDDYDDCLLNRVNSSYSCFWLFMVQSWIFALIFDFTHPQSINFMTQLWLGLGYRALVFTSEMNL